MQERNFHPPWCIGNYTIMTEFSPFFSLFLAITSIGYVFTVAVLSLSLGRVRRGSSEDRPFVTVVVAARNEENSIASCLGALRLQNYSSDRFEVIVSDDRSTDKTPDILNTIAGEWNQLSTIRIDSCPTGISPKKNALARAIHRARGDIILQTDADCVCPGTWISGMVRRFETGIDMVAGVAPYISKDDLMGGFVAHEYLWNVLLSAGSIALGAGTHASGRNLGFRRSAFNAVLGYGDTEMIRSGDDTLLMHRFQRANRSGIATNPDPETFVYTNPPSTFREFYRQRVRHLSTGKYFHPFQVAAGAVVYSFHIGILASLVLAFVSWLYLLPALGLFLIKAAADAIAFRNLQRVFPLAVDWRWFPVHECLLTTYLAVFPILGLVAPVRWKETC